MTLSAFLLNVYGKQRRREEGEEKKVEMEVLKDVGIQRFVCMLGIHSQVQTSLASRCPMSPQQRTSGGLSLIVGD